MASDQCLCCHIKLWMIVIGSLCTAIGILMLIDAIWLSSRTTTWSQWILVVLVIVAGVLAIVSAVTEKSIFVWPFIITVIIAIVFVVFGMIWLFIHWNKDSTSSRLITLVIEILYLVILIFSLVVAIKWRDYVAGR